MWLGKGQTQTRDRNNNIIHQRFNYLGFSYSQEWAATEKGLVNYCRVVWIDRKGVALPVVVIVDVLTGYLSVYFYIYWQLLMNIFMVNLATKLKRIAQ